MFIYLQSIKDLYHQMGTKLQSITRPLTYTEKILLSHMSHIPLDLCKGISTVTLTPDRVAMQDASAQMAILQFMVANKSKVHIPTSVHCDHLIRASKGAQDDLLGAIEENREVYDFLRSASDKYGMGFWKPGSGIIHQVVLENYAVPGQILLGTDSHSPNAGGLGMIAIGVGGADAVDAITPLPWSVLYPKIIGVKLTGALQGWTSPKDIIIALAGILTVNGGTGAIIEYFGEGAKSISCTGKATITNMGAEVGATTSLFPYDEKMSEYLRATRRSAIADLADAHKEMLRADEQVLLNPEHYYDKVIEIDLNTLEPHITGPHSPDLARPISRLKEDVLKHGWPSKISSALIGSCTNSSYEDMGRAAYVAASGNGQKAQCEFLITPGSEQINDTIIRDGIMDSLKHMGGIVLANACGPCIGQWSRKTSGPNSIVTSYNRNFPKRNDGSAQTYAFIASPEIVTALAFAGTLEFNPLTDTVNGVQLKAPKADEIPKDGFVGNTSGYIPPTFRHQVVIAKESQRLQELSPFPIFKDYSNLLIIAKAKGKCTTDHISPAGKWLTYRGHLENISMNLFSGVVNAFDSEPGFGINYITEEKGSLAEIAKYYHHHKIGWVFIGDENYGEGSSREHAAMEPRYRGCRAVIAKSFARIAETNLKKQGVLPLQLSQPSDYDLFLSDDKISIKAIASIAPGEPVVLEVKHKDGTVHEIETSHSLTEEQILWFKAGSALNLIRQSS